MTKLVFVHGRSQHGKDPLMLKRQWLEALAEGLGSSVAELPVAESEVRLAYYGDTLDDLAAGRPDVAEVISRGADPQGVSVEEMKFAAQLTTEFMRARGVTDRAVVENAAVGVVEKGPLNWWWVRSALQLLDRHPGVSALSLATFTRDVYCYLSNSRARTIIDTGLDVVIPHGEPTVVVAHSLGTVVAFNVIRRRAPSTPGSRPALITLGSPLAVNAIQSALDRPLEYPAGISGWMNAMDPADIVALHPLDHAHFLMNGQISNYQDVVNTTADHHGIDGYLSDPHVAATIKTALVTGYQR